MRILGIVPARGGSKGVPRKNIRPLHGKPLIAWTIAAARECPLLSRVVISTEDAEIGAVAGQWGGEVLARPAELARDETLGVDVILHALHAVPGPWDLVVMLQPTSPLRVAADITACIRLCTDGAAPASVSVVRATEPPAWMFAKDAAGRLEPVVPRSQMPLRRQDLAPAFLLNGAVYVAQPAWLERHRTFLGPDVHGYEMPAERSLDIDTLEDFAAAEAVFARRGP